MNQMSQKSPSPCYSLWPELQVYHAYHVVPLQRYIWFIDAPYSSSAYYTLSLTNISRIKESNLTDICFWSAVANIDYESLCSSLFICIFVNFLRSLPKIVSVSCSEHPVLPRLGKCQWNAKFQRLWKTKHKWVGLSSSGGITSVWNHHTDE